MGVEYYNPSSNSSGNLTSLYRPKILTYTNHVSPKHWPFWRSGASDKYLKTSNTNINDEGFELHSYTSTTDTTVASWRYDSLTGAPAAARACAYHMNSTDQCVYILVAYNSGSTHWAFLKINDTTGANTSIGSYFIPTTPTNWPQFSDKADMIVDPVSGHLKLIYNGVYHLVNKTTGAIVSQDTPITIGSYSMKGVYYVTTDGSLGVTANGYNLADASSNSYPSLISASGVLPSTQVSNTLSTFAWRTGYGNQVIISGILNTVDTDKLAIFMTSNGSGGPFITATTLYRTEFDKMLKSYQDYITAV